jgi:hypothetical protein
MAVRIERIIALVLDEARERQVEEAMNAFLGVTGGLLYVGSGRSPRQNRVPSTPKTARGLPAGASSRVVRLVKERLFTCGTRRSTLPPLPRK